MNKIAQFEEADLDENAALAENDAQNLNDMAVSEMVLQVSQSPMSSATTALVAPGPVDKMFPNIVIGKINEAEPTDMQQRYGGPKTPEQSKGKGLDKKMRPEEYEAQVKTDPQATKVAAWAQQGRTDLNFYKQRSTATEPEGSVAAERKPGHQDVIAKKKPKRKRESADSRQQTIQSDKEQIER